MKASMECYTIYLFNHQPTGNTAFRGADPKHVNTASELADLKGFADKTSRHLSGFSVNLLTEKVEQGNADL